MNITVVGAGVIGCSIAHQIAWRGADVRVVDPRPPGFGATQASAGILAPSIDRHSPSLMGLCRTSLGMYEAFVARVEADAGVSLEYERGGMLHVALDVAQADRLAAMAEELVEAGVEHSLLSGRDVRADEPALPPAVVAALNIPLYGHVGALALTEGLAQAAERRGATFTRARVVSVEGRSRGAAVRTEDETIDSDAVIVTAGSWASPLLDAAGPEIRPIRGQLLHLRTKGRLATRVIHGERCYLVPWRDGTVLLGATVEDVGFDERSTVAGVRELLDASVDLLPALASASVDVVRVGLRPRGPDELPTIGRSTVAPNVFLAVGHYRNGVLLSPLTARLVADLVLDGREGPELSLVRPDRFAARELGRRA